MLFFLCRFIYFLNGFAWLVSAKLSTVLLIKIGLLLFLAPSQNESIISWVCRRFGNRSRNLWIWLSWWIFL